MFFSIKKFPMYFFSWIFSTQFFTFKICTFSNTFIGYLVDEDLLSWDNGFDQWAGNNSLMHNWNWVNDWCMMNNWGGMNSLNDWCSMDSVDNWSWNNCLNNWSWVMNNVAWWIACGYWMSVMIISWWAIFS